ncbi:MAG TPA: hypothetical protein VM639_13260 [Dongiaceae bacterium]|nr:hypothetical protein [Dongiaceae bacterium]
MALLQAADRTAEHRILRTALRPGFYRLIAETGAARPDGAGRPLIAAKIAVRPSVRAAIAKSSSGEARLGLLPIRRISPLLPYDTRPSDGSVRHQNRQQA